MSDDPYNDFLMYREKFFRKKNKKTEIERIEERRKQRRGEERVRNDPRLY